MYLRIAAALIIGVVITYFMFPMLYSGTVQKEPFVPSPLNTPPINLDTLPPVRGNGFSLDESYNDFPVPRPHEEFRLPVVHSPSAAAVNGVSRNDAFHTYYRKLYESLDG